MIRVMPFVASDLLTFEPQPFQRHMVGDPAETAVLFLGAAQSFTVRSVGGRGRGDRVLMVAAVNPIMGSNGLIHALLAGDIGAEMVGMTRVSRRYLDAMAFERLTAWVDLRHEEALRWVRLLGFAPEGLMPRFGENGEDMMGFGRVRG